MLGWLFCFQSIPIRVFLVKHALISSLINITMKKVVFLLLATTILAASCKEDSNTNPLTINSVNKIRFQETLSDGNISIKFLEVVNDSRCPANANCVWLGNAEIKFELMENNESIPFELFANAISQLGMSNDTIISDYSIEVITLEPYPETSDEIPPSTYFAEILVYKDNKVFPSQN